MSDRNPGLSGVLAHFRESILRDLHVAFPAEVMSYDPSTQLADVRPLLAEAYTEDDDTVTQVAPPVVSGVKVQFPGAGGFRVSFPVQAGDTGLCVCTDRSLDAWLAQGGAQAPGDLRRHNISDAVFLPGLKPNSSPWTGASQTALTLGRDGGTDDAVALANAVLNRLTAIVNGFNTHTHTSAAPGSPTTTPTAPLSAPSSVASASVKIKE
jgi:hypothetical protein